MIPRAIGALFLSAWFASSFGAAPELEGLHPSGGTPGSTNAVALAGKFDPWPPRIWVSDDQLVFHSTTNKGKMLVEVKAGAKPGPRLVRAYNDDGASETRFFIVGAGNELNEVEPNDDFKKPQVISEALVTLNGRLDKRDDVDAYAVDLRADETLRARVESYTLMSKVDAALRLVDTNGYQLCWNHDHATFDPLLTYTAKRDQRVVLQIFGFAYPATSEVRFFGGDAAHYRIHFKRGRDLTSNHWPIEKKSTNLVAGVPLQGVIADGKSINRHTFSATKDQPLEFKLKAATLGSPLDAWMRIEDAEGKELARNDDADGSLDPALQWTPRSDGPFAVAIGSVTHRGSSAHIYELSFEPLKPIFSATLSAGALVLNAPSTNELKFKLERLHGHTNELRAELRGLPENIIAEGLANLPAKTGDVTVKLIAPESAPAFNAPVELLLTDLATQQQKVVPFSLLTRGENNGVPNGYQTLVIPEVPHLWLTIRPKPPATNTTAATP